MMSSSLPSSSSSSPSSGTSCALLLGFELHLTTSTFKHFLSVSLTLKHLYTNSTRDNIVAQKQLSFILKSFPHTTATPSVFHKESRVFTRRGT